MEQDQREQRRCDQCPRKETCVQTTGQNKESSKQGHAEDYPNSFDQSAPEWSDVPILGLAP
jgi:hypothetical protein